MATPSTSNSIRSQVANIITTSKAKGNSTVSQIKNLPTKERYSRLIGAATALHRASTNPSYKMSDTQKKDCAAAAMIIAEKRGIQPTNDGKYTQEQVKEFLDPKEMLTNLASYYIYDAKQEGTKETDTRQAIKQDIEAAYDNDQTAAQPTVAIAAAAPAKLPDSIILSMTEEDRNNYILSQDQSEQERLEDLCKDSLGKDPSLDEIVDYQGLRDDPDWGHKKDDDDFKIEQGDIIEYLMKDVILASAAWAGNRVAGFAGTVSFELLHAGVKEFHPYGRKAKDAIAEGWDKFKRGLFGDGNDNDNLSPTPDNNNPPPENTFDTITGAYDRTRKKNSESLQAQKEFLSGNNPNLEKLHKLHSRIIKHSAVLGDDSITFDDGTTKSYQDFCGEGKSPEDLKNELKTIQENADKAKLNNIIKALGAENDDAKKSEITEWYQKHTQEIENIAKKGEPLTEENKQHPTYLEIANSSRPQNATIPSDKFADAYIKAETELNAQRKMDPYIQIMDHQQKLFSAHYGMHKYLEEIRKNPQGEIATNLEKATEFFQKQEAEAKTLFYTVEKARREGKTELNGHPIPSREEMVTEAEKLVEKSKQSNAPVEDAKLKPLYTKPANKNQEQSLYDAAIKGDLSDKFAAEMLNLDNLAAAQQGNKEEIDKRRNQLNAFKERIFKETKAKDGKGVNIGQKYDAIKAQRQTGRK